ncbi:MAG: hypothetical protein K6A92_10620 [Lachnospiraceae bacterium]|nr:hypothetical protein [Lachnospiraceae bacterium]
MDCLMEMAQNKTKEAFLIPEGEIRKRFYSLGNEAKGSVTIDLACLGEPEDLNGCFLAGEAFGEGAYRWGWEKLRYRKEHTPVFPDRDALSTSCLTQEPVLKGNHRQKECFREGLTFSRYVNYARTLGNLPANYLRIGDMVEYISRVCEESSIGLEILREKELSDLSCNGILAVNKGSEEPAALAVLTYKTDETMPLTALVGKGVMFDSGGYHLKEMSSMRGMKYDMCGAATVLEIMEYLAKTHCRCNVIGVLSIVENMISEKACRIDDVITTMSGKLVEIYNTDAEGRLILCDAISYAASRGAVQILDLATLTYSCREALGDHVTGIFCNREDMFRAFAQAATGEEEKIWRLPLGDDYRAMVRNTQVADLINYGPGQGAGASFAASFLEAFVPENVGWIHLDCVGPAVRKEPSQYGIAGATGVMAGSILNYILR